MKNFVQHVKQAFRSDLRVNLVLKFEYGTPLARIHAMTPVKIHPILELVFFDVIFDDLDGILVSPRKTGTAQTYDQFLLVLFGILVHGPVKIGIY